MKVLIWCEHVLGEGKSVRVSIHTHTYTQVFAEMREIWDAKENNLNRFGLDLDEAVKAAAPHPSSSLTAFPPYVD